jgi:uncharacterized protein involved in exopolysaccharide biosynthesis
MHDLQGPVDQRDSQPPTEAFPLTIIVTTLWAYRWLILAIACLGALAGLGVAVTQKPVYEAQVTLVVADSKLRDGGSVVTPATIVTVLANRQLAQRLLQEFHLDGPPYGYSSAAMLGAVRFEDVRNSSLVRVRVRLLDAELAMRVANRFAELAIELNATLNQRDTAAARDLVKAQLAEAEARLDKARAALLSFQQGALVELSKADANALISQREDAADWAVTLAIEKARLAQYEKDLAAQPATTSGARASSLDAGLVDAVNQAVRDTEQPRGLSTPAASAPPPDPMSTVEAESATREALRRREERIDGVRREERRLDQRDQTRRADELPVLPGGESPANPVRLLLEYQAAASRARVAALEQRRKELARVSPQADGPGRQLDRLYRGEGELARRELDVRVAERAYVELAQRYELARLQVGGRSAELQIIDPAILPRGSVSWGVVAMMTICGAAGLVGAMGVVAAIALVRTWLVR